MVNAILAQRGWRIFIVLQLCDVLTTLVALSIGLQEANPILRSFFPLFGHNAGLIIAKTMFCVLFVCYFSRLKTINLKFVNLAFAVIVVWNMAVLLLNSI